MTNRRRFILASTLLGASAYSYQRGLRYPRLGFEHPALDISTSSEFAVADFTHAILRGASTTTNQQPLLRFRAIAPEPSIKLKALKATALEIQISNIADNAILGLDSDAAPIINEQIEGTTRHLTIHCKAEQSFLLKWLLAEQDEAKFAVIGDTGAGLELEWAIQRARELGAQFLLHLGDFNYHVGEYNRAVELFDSSPLPCYVSIGNHDYNDSGLVYQQFLDEIGPMNQAFSVAGSRFVNIDTAANFLPASSGQRGRLFSQLTKDTANYDDQVFFTHRPFIDIRQGHDHNISGIGEMAWLAAQIKDCGANTILCGHVHHSGEVDYQGIHQWTAGEGLGFEDIVHQKQIAKLLIGKVERGHKITYGWQPLKLPWQAHRSPAHKTKLIKEHSAEKLRWYQQMLERHPLQQNKLS